MNNAIAISTALTILALVISIFAASWLNQRAMTLLIQQLEKRFDERFTALEQRFEQRFASIEQRLDRIERQLEAIFKPVLPSR